MKISKNVVIILLLLKQTELLVQHESHINQISQWKQGLLDNTALIFDIRHGKNSKKEIKKSHAKIDRVIMEMNFYPKCLIAISGRKADHDRSKIYSTNEKKPYQSLKVKVFDKNIWKR